MCKQFLLIRGNIPVNINWFSLLKAGRIITTVSVGRTRFCEVGVYVVV